MSKGPTKPNKTGRATLADVVMTPISTAQTIVEYFAPSGKVLEPCKGTGHIYDLLPGDKDWCEVNLGRDFFDYNEKVDWIITNPPYSIYDKFLLKCLEVSDEVVLLVPLSKFFRGMKVSRQIDQWGGIKEIVHLGTGNMLGFTFGFPVGCIHYSKGWNGDVKYTKLYE